MTEKIGYKIPLWRRILLYLIFLGAMFFNLFPMSMSISPIRHSNGDIMHASAIDLKVICYFLIFCFISQTILSFFILKQKLILIKFSFYVVIFTLMTFVSFGVLLYLFNMLSIDLTNNFVIVSYNPTQIAFSLCLGYAVISFIAWEGIYHFRIKAH